jgi:hypothetical protein
VANEVVEIVFGPVLSEKIGTFDQAKDLIFFYDSLEEPEA